jgi:hypothetical protein
MNPLVIVIVVGMSIVCLVFMWMIISGIAALFGSDLGGYALILGSSDGTAGPHFLSLIAGGKRRGRPNMGILLLALALGILGGYIVGTPSAN